MRFAAAKTVVSFQHNLGASLLKDIPIDSLSRFCKDLSSDDIVITKGLKDYAGDSFEVRLKLE
jgi:hypothetical protein